MTKQKTTGKRKSDHSPIDNIALTTARMSKGIKTKTLANEIKAQFKEAATPEREVYYIMQGKRKHPNPQYVKQITEILGVNLEDIIKAE